MVQKTEIEEFIASIKSEAIIKAATAMVAGSAVRILGIYSDVIRAQAQDVDIRFEFTPQAVKISTSCNCRSKEKLCRHSLAVLMKTAKELNKDQTVSRKGVRYWREMASGMTDVDLQNFVSDYAQRNKSFAMEMRARNLIMVGDEEALRYAQDIFDEIKHPLATSVRKPSSTSLRLAINTLKSIYGSTLSLINERLPLKGSLILIQLMTTAHYVIHRKNSEDPTLNKLIRQGEDEIVGRLRGFRAPEIVDAIFEGCVDMIGMSYYSPASQNFIIDLFELQKLPELQMRLLKKLENQIVRSEGIRRANWIKNWLLCRLGAKNELDPVPKDLIDHEDYGMIWEFVTQLNLTEVRSEVMEILYTHIPNPYRHAAFDLALKLSNYDLAFQLLLQFKDFDLTSVSEEVATQFLKYAKGKKKQLPETHQIILLKQTRDKKKIESYVKANNALNITAEFCDQQFLYESLITETYLKDQIDQYLSQHIGPKSRSVLNTVLNNLKSGKNKDLRDSISKYLSKNYNFKTDALFHAGKLIQL